MKQHQLLPFVLSTFSLKLYCNSTLSSFSVLYIYRQCHHGFFLIHQHHGDWEELAEGGLSARQKVVGGANFIPRFHRHQTRRRKSRQGGEGGEGGEGNNDCRDSWLPTPRGRGPPFKSSQSKLFKPFQTFSCQTKPFREKRNTPILPLKYCSKSVSFCPSGVFLFGSCRGHK